MSNRITRTQVQGMYETLVKTARDAGVDTTDWAIDARGSGYLFGKLAPAVAGEQRLRPVGEVFARFDGLTRMYEHMAAMNAAFGMVLSMPVTPRPDPSTSAVRAGGLPVGRCEANAVRGTGTGACDRPLGAHGECDRPGAHL